MGLLLAFAPFIAFALVDRLVGPVEGLAVAAAASLGLLAKDGLAGRSLKVLDLGSTLLFGGLALFVFLRGGDWSVFGIRVLVDAGLLAIVLVSIAIRRPFTLQYAREGTPPEIWSSKRFVRANYVISAVWAGAFAVMVLAELAILYAPGVPHQLGVAAVILALVAAMKFTNWYPKRVAA